ncbi:hypothetical protein AGLY_012933 [Aphis glycines]|uniref:Uncharacterized protein n=1 Tax=Aphis glycines TaxID=307491 RepID=A0A6G0T8K9_APHGL|nr:hypothetical protein AGLY_012933 [Aphis glycines]
MEIRPVRVTKSKECPAYSYAQTVQTHALERPYTGESKSHWQSQILLKWNLRTTMLEKFKQNFKSERVGNIFEKHNRGKDEIIRASYEVANLIARENKSFSDGEFVKKFILASVKEIIPEKMSVFENISLSRNTITRRVEDIGALDESTDVSDTAQLLIFIRGIDTDYNITEELASLESISGTTKGSDIFEKVNCCIENLGLTWEKLCSITTDGAPNMVGRNTGLVGRIAELTTSKMIVTPIFLHCIIHQKSLCGKIMNLEHVMNIVTKTVNFIRSHGLKHRQFIEFLNEIESEYKDVLYHNQKKNKPVEEFENEQWMYDLAFLTDISAHLNELNLKLQKQSKTIFELIKIKQNSLIDAPTNHFVSMLEQLSIEFENRFQDFKSNMTSFRLIENSFLSDENNVHETVQLELIDLKTNNHLKDLYRDITDKNTDLIHFYKTLTDDFPKIKELSMRIFTLFGSTYICEQTFSLMNYVKCSEISCLTNEHLHFLLRIGITHFTSNIERLVKEKQAQISR